MTDRVKVLEVVIEGIQNISSEPKELPEVITEEMSLRNDLNMDSLDFIEVIMFCEKELNIGIPDEKTEALSLDCTVKDLVDLIMLIEP